MYIASGRTDPLPVHFLPNENSTAYDVETFGGAHAQIEVLGPREVTCFEKVFVADAPLIKLTQQGGVLNYKSGEELLMRGKEEIQQKFMQHAFFTTWLLDKLPRVLRPTTC